MGSSPAPRGSAARSAGSSLIDEVEALGGISSRFQPILSLEADRPPRVVALECLTRGPADSDLEAARTLFTESRRRDETVEVDRLCLETGLRAAGDLGLGDRDLGDRDPDLFFNVHASTLEADRELAHRVAHEAEQAGIAMDRLVLEIVEAEPMVDAAAFQVAIHHLRRHGARIALDDVGQGHATNRMILAVRPDFIKLDRFLVRGVYYDVGRRALVSSYHHMARELGIRAVAEGVETPTQLLALREIGVGFCQGFLFFEPMTPGEIRRRRLLEGDGPELAELVPVSRRRR
jgi:EAL domain-containing protein (putative c-di-GMP-specific phosphodiesterase class I)